MEKIEKQMVSRSEGKELAANSIAGPAESQDWDAAWLDNEGQTNETLHEKTTQKHGKEDEMDTDGADAWDSRRRKK